MGIAQILDAMDLAKGERALFLADREADGSEGPAALAAMALAEAATARGCEAEAVTYVRTRSHGSEPPEEVWRAAWGKGYASLPPMLRARLYEKTADARDMEDALRWARAVGDAAPDVVVATTTHSTSHTSFRRLLTDGAGARYGSMPQFDEGLLRKGGPLDADLVAGTKRLVAKLAGARRVRVRGEGTDLSFSVEGRTFHGDDGDLSRPGAFGNLPGGEAYTAPIEGTAKGRLRLVAAPNRILDSVVDLIIIEGAVKEISGSDPFAARMNEILREHPEHLRVAELGIGTNPGASRMENILEAEKILGSVHIAFGDNATFGGTQRVPFHEDYVVPRATLEIDGEKILDRGTPRW